MNPPVYRSVKENGLRFGLGVSTCREGRTYPVGFANLHDSAKLAVQAEQLGFYSLWGNDHLITQSSLMDSLPEPPDFYEPLVTFAYLASKVTSLKFVTSTLIAPLRSPVQLAKQAATLDHASNGRVVLGLGIGANRHEFEVIANPARSANRGRIMEESVEALRLLFSGRRVRFDGDYWQFDEIEVHPEPVQEPLPIYLSGNSTPAIQRVARIADGWIVATQSPTEIRGSASLLRDTATQAGRKDEIPEVCTQLWVSIGKTHDEAVQTLGNSQHYHGLQRANPDGDLSAHAETFASNNLLGDPDEIVQRVQEYDQAGVQHFGLIFLAADKDELLSKVKLFGEHVIPHVN